MTNNSISSWLTAKDLPCFNSIAKNITKSQKWSKYPARTISLAWILFMGAPIHPHSLDHFVT
ncbi:MAG TPA: hypothetical protein DER18_02000 [Shewanella baltica]|nr:hypothetical protein [Shewanella baltica]